MGSMLPYIAAPWILWVGNFMIPTDDVIFFKDGYCSLDSYWIATTVESSSVFRYKNKNGKSSGSQQKMTMFCGQRLTL